ncbi:MAG TPA: PAS domain-containing protein [Sphingomonas sp.]|jgi:PAS domain S-box-containing protein|uniref:PAS domain-containing protein n=1 Tax=Sphingomonas sp. TaxID=28214 RepID=UPI002ED93F66
MEIEAAPDPYPAFLRGGGEMADRIARHDWPATPLGPIACWPAALRTTLGVVLGNPFPQVVIWGPSRIMLYNDAYGQVLGDKPPALGRPFLDVWADARDIIGPLIEDGFRGKACLFENGRFTLLRGGRLEEAFFDFTVSPVRDEQGMIVGVLNIGIETTARVREKRERRRDAARQRRLFEQAPGFICAMRGPNHVFEFVNDTHHSLFGSEDWVGKPVREAFPDIVGQGFYELLDQVYNSGERVVARAAPVRYRRTPDAPEELRYLDFIYAPVVEASGRISGVFCEGQDVTDRRQAEQDLRRSEEQLRLAVEAGQIGLWDIDVPSGTLFWPARMKAMFGISPDRDVTLADFYAGLHPDDHDAVAAAFAAALDPARRAPYDVEYRTVGKEDDVVRWIAVRGQVQFDEQGTCVRVIGTAIDITRQKAAEAAVRASEARLRELNADLERRVIERAQARGRSWQVSPDLMGALNVNGYFETSNPAWQTILGWTEDEVARLPIFDLLHPDDAEPSRSAFALPRWDQPAVNFQGRYRCKDGTYRWISWVGVPDEGLIYCVGRDITADKEREIELEQTQQALRQAQKIEAIGQLTGGIAHDFNNLLMVISGGLEMLDRQKDPARRQRLMTGMQQAAQRGAGLTRQLLAFSRRQPLRPEPLDVAGRIGGMRELLDRSLRGDIHVDIAFPDGLWPVLADAGELELVILNLCVNARDAMPAGGTISITAENRPGLAMSDADGDHVRVTVSDTGTGMPPEVIARVFEPFYTTKEIGKGSGLGLAQAYGFAQQSGGTIAIDSVVGQGTTIAISLPRSRVAPIDMPEGAGRSVSQDGRHAGCCLLVEDDDEVATLVQEMLATLGFNVVRTASAEAALGALANGRAVDFLFSDIMMPGTMNGVQLAQEVHRRRPDLPILLTSGYADASIRDVEADRFPILSKPYEMDALSAAITAAMHAERGPADRT